LKNVEIQIQCSNPDAICTEYGADTLRLYEMFLGPLNKRNLGTQQEFREFLVSKNYGVCI
jgi:leucyl-tRNA synthetase